MTEKFITDCIQKVIFLKEKLGQKVSYKALEPFYFDYKDIISIQKCAKFIASFVGLEGFIFIVVVVNQKKGIGGHIELNYGSKDVFIEISEEIMESREAVLAVLAHEITHQYLYYNKVTIGSSSFLVYENEILIDIATVFLGMGKIMLNGCKVYYGKYVTYELKMAILTFLNLLLRIV